MQKNLAGRKSSLKSNYKQKITDIADLKATDTPKKVVIVNKRWHNELVNWINNKGESRPSALNTKSLLSASRVKPNLKRGEHYEIIDSKLWNDLTRNFGTTTKIEAILTKNPKNGEETILFDFLEFKVYLPRRRPSTISASHLNSYSTSPSGMPYYCDPSWIIEDVKKQICESHRFEPSSFSFSPHASTNPNEHINESITMKDVSKRYKNEIDLKPNSISKNRLPPINDNTKKNSNNTPQYPSSLRPRKPSVPRFKRMGAYSDKKTPELKLTEPSSNETRLTNSNNAQLPPISSSTSQSPRNSSRSSETKADGTPPNSDSITHPTTTIDLVIPHPNHIPSITTTSSNTQSHAPSTTTTTITDITSREVSLEPKKSPYSTPRSIISPYNGSRCPKPVGLNNLGNTCFFNAAVQCLARCMPLTNFILSKDFERQINPNNPKSSKGKIAQAYRSFLEDLCKGSGYARDPSQLRRAVVSKFKRFANFGQHDSQELLCSLLDGLHEDMNQSAYAKGNESPRQTGSNSDSWDVHVSRNSSPIVDIFHGVLYSSISCPECKRVEKVRDPFMFLSLDIPRLRFNVKLNDCLSSFCQKETLDERNKWKCEGCKNMVKATKEMGVERCGQKILIIHLKRFSGEGYFASKIDTSVDYPDELDAKTFANSDRGTFRLIGAVFHSGGLGGGHYTAAAVDPESNDWYNFNDSMATKINRSEAHKGGAYILFYQRNE